MHRPCYHFTRNRIFILIHFYFSYLLRIGIFTIKKKTAEHKEQCHRESLQTRIIILLQMINRNIFFHWPLQLRGIKTPAYFFPFILFKDAGYFGIALAGKIINRFLAGAAKSAFLVGSHFIPILVTGFWNSDGKVIVHGCGIFVLYLND